MKTFLAFLLLSSSLALHAAPPPPDNDNFTNRIALVASGSISVKGVNAKATTEAGEPTIAGDIVTKSVWWQWSAPFSGPTTINTVGSSFDTLLGVFTGTDLTALSSIAENDDANGLFTSSVTFTATQGIPYVILIGGFNGAGGKVLLNIQVSAAGPCSYSLSPASRSVSNVSSSSSVAVTTTTSCAWTAVSNDSWLTITSNSSGTGSATVTYSISANTALTSRVGTLTVAGLTHTVTQSAAPACTYSVSPTSASFSAASVTNAFSVIAGTTCAWTASPQASWITIPTGFAGTGNGTVTYIVATNSTINSRSGTIIVSPSGSIYTITQAGTVPCTYSISPLSAQFTSSGGTSNIVVSTLGGCTWTASSVVPWVTFSTTNGVGNGTVTYTVAANVSTVPRNGTLTVAGNSFTVSQSGAPCVYSILPSSASVGASGGSGAVSMTAGTGCTWTAVANVTWITITSGSSGSGNGVVNYTVAANPNPSSRMGTLTIGGQTFTVTQDPAVCTYSITPTAVHYSNEAGTGNINVTAGTGCAWTAVANDAWITINSGTPGSGNGAVNYTVATNATTVSRTGTITAATKTFTVTQDGTEPCTYGITPISASVIYTGITNTVAVTANAGCTWSASSGASWITLSPPNGSGNGTVTYIVAANASSSSRVGVLTIAGNTFTVTQAGAPCTFSTSPTSATYTYSGGSGTVVVTATSGCNWTSSSDASWLTVTTGATGVGNGSVTYAVAESTAITNRTGRLTIAGRVTTITQTAAPCTFSIEPTFSDFEDVGGGGNFILTVSASGCAWSASANVTWITVLAPTNGVDSANINYTVAPTTLSSTRSGQITVGGQVFSVNQLGDTTVPTVTLTAPSNGSTVSNTISVTATATDTVGVSRVDFYRDSATLLATDTTSPYSISYATTNVANGSHTFYARGFDFAGNQGLSLTNTVTVSNAAVVPTNQWIQKFGSTGSDTGLAVDTDSASNIILGGAYTGSVNFGSGVLTNAGFEDAVLAKYSSSGAATWSKRFGNTGRDRVNAVAVDTSDNVIAAGFYSGSVDFGGGTITNAGGFNIFVAKYNSAGTFQWAKGFGSSGDDICYGVAVDSSGSVFITGGFTGTVNFGGTNITATIGTDFYIAKFNSAGTHLWSRKAVGNGQEFGYALAIDPNSNVIATGAFSVRIDFGSGLLTTAGSEDAFLAKFIGADGSLSWSQRFGGTAVDRGTGVVANSLTNTTMVGIFSGNVNFGGTNLTTTTGFTDTFLAQYNPSGTHLWSKRATIGSTLVYCNGVAIDSSNNMAIVGYYQSSSANFDGQTVSNAGGSDVFISKYNASGTHSWVRSCGGTLADIGYSASFDPAGFPVATGTFNGTASFIGTPLTSSGLADIFLLKLNP